MEKENNGLSTEPTFNYTEFLKDTEQLKEQSNENNGIKEFPIDVFPTIFKKLINECKESLNFPVDYTGTAILNAVATAIGTSAKLKVKTGWYEFPSLYTVLIGNSGVSKSHPLSFIFEIFIEIDRKKIKEYELIYKEFDEYQSLNKKDKKDILVVEKPKLIKSILHNFSPEILHQRLSDNIRGCTIVSDELATFFEGMNNYSKGDQVSTYLSFWNNKTTSIDRVSKPIPLFIQQPFLNIIGGLQPRFLKKSFPTAKSDNGLLQRFLFAFPDSIEKYPINDLEMNPATLSQYNDFIINYISNNQIEIDIETEKPASKIYRWSNEAKVYFYEWQSHNTIEVNNNADSLKGEILSKFDVHFVRLALVLNIMENSTTNEISLDAVVGADALCKYFIYNAFKVLDILNKPVIPKDTLPLNKLKFYGALPNEFTTAEANDIGLSVLKNEKAVQRFIGDTAYFVKLSQGNYRKLI